MIYDLVTSAIFVLCQLCLLGLVLSSLLLSGKSQAMQKNGWRGILCVLLPAIVVVTAAVDIFKAEYQVDYAKIRPLDAEVLAGREIVIRLYPETCAVFDLGSITCGVDYHGRYKRRENRWVIAGPDSKSGALLTGSSTNGEPGGLSFWGMLSRFEADGTIFYLGQAIGHLRLAKPV